MKPRWEVMAVMSIVLPSRNSWRDFWSPAPISARPPVATQVDHYPWIALRGLSGDGAYYFKWRRKRKRLLEIHRKSRRSSIARFGSFGIRADFFRCDCCLLQFPGQAIGSACMM